MWRRILDFPLVALFIALGIIVACFAFSLSVAAHLGVPTQGSSDQAGFALAMSVPLQVLAYKLFISRLGGNPKDDYRDAKAIRHLCVGLAAGFLLFSAAVGVTAALGIYRITGVGNANGLVPALIGPTLLASVREELVFRGILFRWLEEFGGSWMALLFTSALFGAVHLSNPNGSLISAVGIAFEGGVMLGAAYMLTRSLWMPMGIHAAWNFTQGEFYDIPVSGTSAHGLVTAHLSGPPLLTGGAFGLEASLITIVIATLFGLALVWVAVRRGQVVPPWCGLRYVGAS